MGFRPKKVRLKNGVLSLGMKKDDSRKEVLPFSSKKKLSRDRDGEALQDAASGGKKVHERMQLSVFCSK